MPLPKLSGGEGLFQLTVHHTIHTGGAKTTAQNGWLCHIRSEEAERGIQAAEGLPSPGIPRAVAKGMALPTVGGYSHINSHNKHNPPEAISLPGGWGSTRLITEGDHHTHKNHFSQEKTLQHIFPKDCAIWQMKDKLSDVLNGNLPYKGQFQEEQKIHKCTI